MNKNSKSKFELFADFLYSDEFAELESSKESLLRFQEKLKEQLDRADKAHKKGWKERASLARSKFQESAQNIISDLASHYGSRQDLIKAIQNGVLGGDLQVQFRNRKIDELSDDELRSIIGDKELLDLLHKMKNENK